MDFEWSLQSVSGVSTGMFLVFVAGLQGRSMVLQTLSWVSATRSMFVLPWPGVILESC